MAATRVTEVERNYFVRKVGAAPPTEPLNNLKRRYFYSFLTGKPMSGRTSLANLEMMWLEKVITDAGQSVTDANSYETLWKLAVETLSITPSKYLADNQITFFLNAP